jgi:phenylpyruvate tautomerase PptA (4-oxalocrotonate tautomerase family)
MPTYVVHACAGRLSIDQKAQLARAITRVHCDCTGAPAYFAQVIFHDVPSGNYFVGGKALQGVDHVYVHGTIRAGRDAQTKEKTLHEIARVVTECALLPEHCVQVYITDIPAGQVLEFGRSLPLPGQEQAWWDALPDGLKAKLTALQC